ncbi:MAG: hypothetical protein HY862_20880 [Chloroflexi bacterium]|nr:hypothetical protein [Chloroflexota bacterium]
MAKLSRILFILFIVLATSTLGASTKTSRAQEDGADALTRYGEELYVNINQGLIALDERPLQRNETLDAVAQVIADELGATGSYTSVPPVVADDLGYPRWPDNGQRVISLPYNGIGIESPAEAADFWVEAIAGTLAESYFREIGIGVSNYVAQAGGTVQTAYAIVVGAQPNVIPVVIGDGAATVYSQEVELYVHNELTLSYETDDTTMQRASEVRFASSEAELEEATWQLWDDLNYAVPWQLTEGLGPKEVWVELHDAKGVSVKSVANVELADPSTSPDAATLPAPAPITLIMTYGGDTFTLQVQSDRPTVNLQEVYFTWFDDTRAYELENADNLSDVNLAEFPSGDCIQIRVRSQQSEIAIPGCGTIYLEANEFTEAPQVFWGTDFETFTVLDGPRDLGFCEADAGRCEIRLR